MFDNTTLKSRPALAKKALEAMQEGAKGVVIDKRQVMRRPDERFMNYLISMGVEDLRPSEQASPIEGMEDNTAEASPVEGMEDNTAEATLSDAEEK